MKARPYDIDVTVRTL